MNITHRLQRSTTGQRVAPGALLTAVAVVGMALGGCGDDGGNKQKVTTTTVDKAAVELEVRCELVKSYFDLEGTRTSGAGVDAATRAAFEQRRSQAIDRIAASFKGTVPAELVGPLDQLRTFKLTDDTQHLDQIAPILKQVTTYFDPKCGTVNGKDPDTRSTTTVAGGTASTTATSAATGSTTSAPASSTTAK